MQQSRATADEFAVERRPISRPTWTSGAAGALEGEELDLGGANNSMTCRCARSNILWVWAALRTSFASAGRKRFCTGYGKAGGAQVCPTGCLELADRELAQMRSC